MAGYQKLWFGKGDSRFKYGHVWVSMLNFWGGVVKKKRDG